MSNVRRKISELFELQQKRGWSGVSQFFAQTRRNQRAKKLYRQWVRLYDTLTDDKRQAILEKIEKLNYKPLFSIVMPVYNVEERWLRLAIESVLRQLYPNWELCIADDNSSQSHIRQVLEEYAAQDKRIKIIFRQQNGHISAASNSALEMATGEFTALLDHDDELSEDALYCVTAELNARPETDMIYSDEDVIDDQGRRREPKFKPDWSPDLFYSLNLITHLSVYRTSILRKINGFRLGFEGSQDYDLALRVIEQIPESNICHIPRILYHWRAIPGSVALDAKEKQYAHEQARNALRSHFERTGVEAEVTAGFKHLHRVIYSLPAEKPLVSLVVLFHDGDETQLQKTVVNLLQKTDYANLELIIASSHSLKINFNDLRIRVLVENMAKPAQLFNLAAARASGEILVFVQNGIRAVKPDWLREMASHAWRANVGAVGAKILFPNETISSAGLILGINGLFGNAHRYFSKDVTGHFVRAQSTQNFSAVSEACLGVQKRKFDEINGFDTTNFSTDLFSIDFCLRLLAKGYRVVWTPFSEIIQMSDSSADDAGLETSLEAACFKKKWSNVIANDPFYNVNLTLLAEDFAVAIPPRFEKN